MSFCNAPNVHSILNKSFPPSISADECDGKADYVRCDRCTEVVHKDVYDIHALEPYCKPLSGGDGDAYGRCPLCHEDVPATATGGWRRHLAEPGMCQGNVRHLAQ